MRVGAYRDRSDLVAPFEKVSRRQDGRPLQRLDDVDHKYCPAIVFELQRNLSNESVGSTEVLEEI